MRRFERDPQWRPLTEEEVAFAQKQHGVTFGDLSASSVYWRQAGFTLFGIHWSHSGKKYYDELSGGAQDEVVDYFNQQRRSDVTLVEVELIGLENDWEERLKHPARMLSQWWNRGYGKTVLAEFDCFVFMNPEYQPIRRLVYDLHACACSELWARNGRCGALFLSPFSEQHINHVLLVEFHPREQSFHLEYRVSGLNTDAQNASAAEVWAALRLFVGCKFGITLPEERPNAGTASDGGASGMSIFPITPLVRQIRALIVDTFDVSEQAAQGYAAARVALAGGWGSPETAAQLDWSYHIKKDLGEKLKWRSEAERDRLLQAEKQVWKAFNAITLGLKGR